MKGKKTAVFFPGIGYGPDRPLLYYAKKTALRNGYETIDVAYTDLPKKVKGNRSKMVKSFELALKQAEEKLQKEDLLKCSDVVFVSKSLGGIVAAHYAHKHSIKARHIFFTPLEDTFMFEDQKGIAFHGTKDPWAETFVIRESCRRLKIPLYLYEGANHSLETGDIQRDIRYILDVMEHIIAEKVF